MFNLANLKPMLLGVVLLAGSVPPAMAAVPAAQIAAPSPGTARVWFVRPGSPSSDMYGAVPEIYANGAPVGAIPHNASFYQDFAPGTYHFTVQPYGLPNNLGDTVRLTPGSVTYLEVQLAPAWELGYAGGGGSDFRTFFVSTMAPQLAQAWIAASTVLGQG